MNMAEKFYLRGIASANLEQYAAAIEDFDRAIELAPNHAYIWFERGKCFVRLKKFLAAIKDFSRVIELVPRHD